MDGIHAYEIKKQMKIKEGRNYIPINYLINLVCGCLSGKRGLLSIVASCIYETIIFPKIKGYAEEVIKIFVGIE